MSRPTAIGRLVDTLTQPAYAAGLEARPSVLTATSTASLLLGAPEHYAPMLHALADHDDLVHLLTRIWHVWTGTYPYLRGHLEPLTGLLTHPQDHTTTVLRAQLHTLADLDLAALTERPEVAGDHLGQILTHLTPAPERSARGAFFTPPSLARLLATLATEDLQPGQTIAEPCCGGGGMLVAAIRAMRARGQVPELYSWDLADRDATAVAVAGLALSIHGIPQVRLRCHDVLAAS